MPVRDEGCSSAPTLPCYTRQTAQVTFIKHLLCLARLHVRAGGVKVKLCSFCIAPLSCTRLWSLGGKLRIAIDVLLTVDLAGILLSLLVLHRQKHYGNITLIIHGGPKV